MLFSYRAVAEREWSCFRLPVDRPSTTWWLCLVCTRNTVILRPVLFIHVFLHCTWTWTISLFIVVGSNVVFICLCSRSYWRALFMARFGGGFCITYHIKAHSQRLPFVKTFIHWFEYTDFVTGHESCFLDRRLSPASGSGPAKARWRHLAGLPLSTLAAQRWLPNVIRDDLYAPFACRR